MSSPGDVTRNRRLLGTSNLHHFPGHYLELPWSMGRVEGIITQLKLVKRLGYGRAGIPLLRARVIGAC
jgi:hypothetical protein